MPSRLPAMRWPDQRGRAPALPLALLHQHPALGQPARHREDQRHRHVGGVLGEHARGVRDHDAALQRASPRRYGRSRRRSWRSAAGSGPAWARMRASIRSVIVGTSTSAPAIARPSASGRQRLVVGVQGDVEEFLHPRLDRRRQAAGHDDSRAGDGHAVSCFSALGLWLSSRTIMARAGRGNPDTSRRGQTSRSGMTARTSAPRWRRARRWLLAGWPVAAGSAAPATARGPVTNLPLPRFVSMRAETANARRGPSLDQRVDWEFVRRGLPLEVTAEYGQWRRVRDAEALRRLGAPHAALGRAHRDGDRRGGGAAARPARGGRAVRALAEPRGLRPARGLPRRLVRIGPAESRAGCRRAEPPRALAGRSRQWLRGRRRARRRLHRLPLPFAAT